MTFLMTLPGTAAQGLIWGIMAIGVYITYKVLDIADLTVDGSICTGAATCAMLIMQGWHPLLAMLMAVLAGAICGGITGLLHTFMGIPPILAGILTQLMLWSVNLKIMGKANQSLLNKTVIVSQLDKVVALLIIVAFVIAIIGLLYWFFGTEIGCGIRATGNNQQMSKAQGINVNLNKVIGLMVSNAIVALSGALLAQYQGFADINMGRGAIVIGLAAVIIGEAIMSKISKNFAARLAGVALGGIVYYLVYSFVIFLGLDTELLKMLSAVVVALFLAVPYWKTKYFTHTKVKATADAPAQSNEDEQTATADTQTSDTADSEVKEEENNA